MGELIPRPLRIRAGEGRACVWPHGGGVLSTRESLHAERLHFERAQENHQFGTRSNTFFGALVILNFFAFNTRYYTLLYVYGTALGCGQH
jgi:hypothetical protein